MLGSCAARAIGQSQALPERRAAAVRTSQAGRGTGSAARVNAGRRVPALSLAVRRVRWFCVLFVGSASAGCRLSACVRVCRGLCVAAATAAAESIGRGGIPSSLPCLHLFSVLVTRSKSGSLRQSSLVLPLIIRLLSGSENCRDRLLFA